MINKKDIKIAVKYCGGCNPRYNRRKAVESIEEYFNTKIIPYDESNIPDILLIVNGCESECINIKQDYSNYKTLLINSIDKIKEAIRVIENIIADKKM